MNDIVKERGYSLEFLYDIDNPADFMIGAKILEVRKNKCECFIERHNFKTVNSRLAPTSFESLDLATMGITMKTDNPSFLIEKEGQHYVVSIDSFLDHWEAFKVRYIQGKDEKDNHAKEMNTMKRGDYKGTWLHKEQYDFIYDWLSMMEKNTKKARPIGGSLKLFVEEYFFYISGDDMQQIMNEVEGIAPNSTRWFHNIQIKHLNKIKKELNERPWYLDENEMFKRIEELRTILKI